MIGQTISHYRIVEKLGGGGMLIVYKAHDGRLDRAVALKFLPEGPTQEPQALERFRREARTALNHPGICTIYDIGEQDGRAFIAMEFLDGETLRNHIRGKALPLEEIMKLGMQVAEALDAAHAEGIIHRDIKPANIFVTKRGQAKVLDFGLAKLVPKGVVGAGLDSGGEGGEFTSIVGIISGTPAYMSPEQIRGDNLDPRTDIFSLGLLLYEMATGRQSFSGGTGGVIIEAVLTRSPVPARSINPNIPPRLEEIINKALHKDKDERYQHAADIRTDLQRLERDTETGRTTASAEPEGWVSFRSCFSSSYNYRSARFLGFACCETTSLFQMGHHCRCCRSCHRSGRGRVALFCTQSACPDGKRHHRAGRFRQHHGRFRL